MKKGTAVAGLGALQNWRRAMRFPKKSEETVVASEIPVSKPSPVIAEVPEPDWVSELSPLQRKWLMRAPRSVRYSDASKEFWRKQKNPRMVKSAARKGESALPFVSLRRATLIDITKSKRVIREVLASNIPVMKIEASA